MNKIITEPKYLVMTLCGSSPLPQFAGKKVFGVYRQYDPRIIKMPIEVYWKHVLRELQKNGYIGQVQLKKCIGNRWGRSPHARYNRRKEPLGFPTVKKVLIDTDSIKEEEVIL